VAALRDRIVAAGDDAKQRVECGGAARELAGTGHHQRTGSIVEECRVVDSQLGTHHHVVLVSGAADRVEAAVRLLQFARGNVQLARRELVLEQLDRLAGAQPASLAQRSVRDEPGRGGSCPRQVRVER
jgi:hypothetical protein